ncbi:MAG TPA: class I SAM-dependent methyltransferase [Microvirga sp.]|nr:class I SAM-dependent methyltransferase [Microvirga sp.]
MELEQSVAHHYTHGSLERAVLDALIASGRDTDRLAPPDLAPVDEFHIGGRQATIDFADQLEVRPGLHLLDIGCGLGGASRYFAHERGCQVTGIDLTEEYVRVAESLARRVGLEDRVTYRQGSALDLPFAPETFDGAYMLHVGMNIQDKRSLLAEVRRVLKPGGIFGIYDVMREGEGDLSFPVPWASSPDTSFVESAADYRRLLKDAGFSVEKERSRRDFAIDFFRQLRALTAQSGGPPPLGLHILMGAASPQKVANMMDNLERGLIAPTEIIARAT